MVNVLKVLLEPLFWIQFLFELGHLLLIILDAEVCDAEAVRGLLAKVSVSQALAFSQGDLTGWDVVPSHVILEVSEGFLLHGDGSF